MFDFTFINVEGHEITVRATNEAMGRQFAMVRLWGPYPHTFKRSTQVSNVSPFSGAGLLLKWQTPVVPAIGSSVTGRIVSKGEHIEEVSKT